MKCRLIINIPDSGALKFQTFKGVRKEEPIWDNNYVGRTQVVCKRTRIPKTAMSCHSLNKVIQANQNNSSLPEADSHFTLFCSI